MTVRNHRKSRVRCRDLNPRPFDYASAVIPTELQSNRVHGPCLLKTCEARANQSGYFILINTVLLRFNAGFGGIQTSALNRCRVIVDRYIFARARASDQIFKISNFRCARTYVAMSESSVFYHYTDNDLQIKFCSCFISFIRR